MTRNNKGRKGYVVTHRKQGRSRRNSYKSTRKKRKGRTQQPTYMSRANPKTTGLNYLVLGAIMKIKSSKLPKYKKKILIATVLSTYLGTMPYTATPNSKLPGPKGLTGSSILEYGDIERKLPGLKQKINRRSVRNERKKKNKKSQKKRRKSRMNRGNIMRLIKNNK